VLLQPGAAGIEQKVVANRQRGNTSRMSAIAKQLVEGDELGERARICLRQRRDARKQ
jgi:hypothetical protein